MNFKFLIITLVLTSGFIGGVFAQAQELFKAEAPDEEQLNEIEGKAVLIRTQYGSFMIELFPEHAPNHVEAFLERAESDFYVGTVFHRIIPGFMIQGGDHLTKDPEADPATWGQGRPSENIDNEFNTIKHLRGIVSMARASNPDSAGSQFFIVHQDSLFLDGQYTAFGRLVPGTYSLKNLDDIARLETNSRDQPIDHLAATIIETTVVPYTDSPFSPPQKNPSVIREIKSGGGVIEQYHNIEHDIQFILPYRWAPTAEDNMPNGSFSMIIEPRLPANHSVAKAVEDSGFIPQILIKTEKRDPNMPVDMLVGATSYFSIIGAGEPMILTNHKIENEDGRVVHLITTTQTLKTPEQTFQFKIIQAHFTNYETNYSVIYVNTINYFRYEISTFNQVMSDFLLKTDGKWHRADFTQTPAFRVVIQDSREPPTPEQLPPEEVGGCLIATAAYGSELAPQVQQLRELRDGTILQTKSGSAFMIGFNQLYYSFSPIIADYERENPMFKEAVKLTITPLLSSLALLQYADIDSEQDMLGYGIGVILLNIGMYFVAPAILILKIRSFYKLQ